MAIDAAEALESARLNALALSRHTIWLPAFEGAAITGDAQRVQLPAGSAGTPFYFIVSFMRESVVTARMAIHADTAEIRELRAIERAGKRLRAFVDPLRVLPAAVIANAPAVEPELYWEPSRASASMLDPFFVVNVSGRRLFVRVDGVVFERLEIIGHG
jgi:hypothetical protein